MSAGTIHPQVLPTTIDAVIATFDDLIVGDIRARSRLGYFAALYRGVTIQVKEGIGMGRFDDGPRMERLDVTFANRYLTALEQFRRGESPSQCWSVAFDAAIRWRPLILQQLLLGTNAHINFDLGIAAASVCPGAELPPLKHDFDEINAILAGMVNQVIDEINEVSPWIKFLDQIDPSADNAVINFSMDRARACAWDFASKLAPMAPDDWGPVLGTRDRATADLGRLISHPPGLLFKLGLLVIRLRESSDVPKVIAVLERTGSSPGAGLEPAGQPVPGG
jgi:hypothetical protein